jgi:hypothetical protein
MRAYRIITLAIIACFILFISSINSGCSKPEDTLPAGIVTPPPAPVLPGDTVSLVKKLEILSSLYPNYAIKPYQTYTFSYDGLKRLTSVGIKTYPTYVTDTFTTTLKYTGNNMHPDYIIQPAIDIFGPPSVDTTRFFYAADGKLQKDSCLERWYGGSVRRPLYRLYTYPSSTMAKIDWYWSATLAANASLQRQDTVRVDGAGRPNTIKSLYSLDQTGTGQAGGSYALAEGFTFSQIINPLSKLNISGTPYSLIYAGVKKELLGNIYHPLVYNSNGAAIYLDFISPYIPNIFYIWGYSSTGVGLGQGADAFPIEITPWTVRSSYPAEIRVQISTSLAGDSYIYRYKY